MATVIDKEITSLDISWENYAGQRVEEFLKKELRSKYGYVKVSDSPDSNGYYHLLFFADEDSYNNYVSDPTTYADNLLQEVIIPVSPSTGTTYQLKLTTTSSTTEIISIDGTVKVNVNLSSTRKVTGYDAEEYDVTAQFYIYGRVSGGSWSLLQSTTLESGVDTEIDLSDLVPSDSNGYQIRTQASATIDGNNVSSNVLTFNSITKTSLSLEWATDWQTPFNTSELSTIPLKYYIYGSVDKVLHLKVYSGTSYNEMTVDIGTTAYATVAYEYGYADTSSSSVKVMDVYGVHKVEAWLTCGTLESEHITNSFMIITDDATEEELSKNYLLLQNVKSELTNYVSADFFDYTVYSPKGNSVPLEFYFTNSAETTELWRYETNAESGTKYTLTNTLEIEDTTSTTIYTLLHAESNGEDLLTDSVGTKTISVLVDNTESYVPTTGADFVLNPKTRSNEEEKPETIINAADGSEVEATFENFGFITDGWTTDDDGNRCLRVPAGRKLTINYEAFSKFISAGDSAQDLTIELDFSVRNVTDEDTPIFSMCSYDSNEKPRGVEMRPLEGLMMTEAHSTKNQQNFAWQEDTRTHIAFNIVHNLRSSASDTTEIPYARVFINGVINREFMFSTTSDEEWVVNGNSGGIRIGQDGADIDIYSIRIYKKALSAADIRQDYVAAIPNATDKSSFKAANDITNSDGTINYAKASAKYNCIVWFGENVSFTSQSSKKGNLYVSVLKSDGTQDNAHSGNLTNMTLKGQGSTAKTYYEWNCQWQWADKTSGTFTDLDGNEIGQKYQLMDGVPYAKKLVGKINYASSMQSHKQGACELYNDLYRLLCGSDKQVLQDDDTARVAVIERPFLYFTQGDGETEPTFQGLMTFGCGKMDKPSWGFDLDTYPSMMMLEGSDNNEPLTDERMPWDDNIKYDAEEEYLYYEDSEGNAFGQLDFDAGATNDDGSPSDTVLQSFKDAWNFCYEHSPYIKYYDGTYAQLVADTSVSTYYEYWVTAASTDVNAYDLFRYDHVKGEWVHSTRRDSNGEWQNVNLMDDWGITTGALAQMNDCFIAKRVSEWAENVGTYFYITDLKFHHEIGLFWAGTDNQSKNTYYMLYPNTSGVYKIALHQDDLDTIFKTDNTGWQTKPYYIENRDSYQETESDGSVTTKYYWDGQYNVLFRLTELAWGCETYTDMSGATQNFGDKSLPTMMKNILTQMANLKGSLEKCLQSYFFWIQEYFPAVAYNETARIRYENAQLAVQNGTFSPSRSIQPISQSLGDQLQAEKEYMKKRLVYMSSYAAYGEFAGAGTGLSIEGYTDLDGNECTYVFEITAHQWVYPTGSVGQSIVNPHYRLEAGKTYLFTVGTSKGDTAIRLNGMDYYSSIGNLGDISVKPTAEFALVGKRLVDFIANPTGSAHFRPASVTVSATMIEEVDLNGCTLIGGSLDLSKLTRLKRLDLRNTAITNVTLPQTSTLTEIRLPETITKVSITGCPNLSTLSIDGYTNITSFVLTNAKNIKNTYTIAYNLYKNATGLKTLTLEDLSWDSCSADMLMWMANLGSTINGSITMTSPTTDRYLTLAEIINLMNLYGNITDENNDLYISYQYASITSAVISGTLQIKETGEYQYSLTTTPTAGNNIYYQDGQPAIKWEIEENEYGSFSDDVNGILKVTALDDAKTDKTYTMTVTLTTYTKSGSTVTTSEVTATLAIRFHLKIPAVGDFAYADGTFDTEYVKNKAYVGLVFMREEITDGDGNVTGYHCHIVGAEDAIGYKSDGDKWSETWRWGAYPNGSSANNNGFSTAECTEILEACEGTVVGSFPDVSTMVNYTSYGVSNPLHNNIYDDDQDDAWAVFTSDCAKITSGKKYTQAMIDYAHALLQNYYNNVDGVTAITNPTTLTELADAMYQVQTDISAKEDSYPNRFFGLFFPAAYAAYAYEPEADDLCDDYKKSNWYLPSATELIRIYGFFYNGTAVLEEPKIYDDEGNLLKEARIPIFANANTRIGSVKLTMTKTSYWISIEYSSYNAWRLDFSNGILNYTSHTKYLNYRVRPVVAFNFYL